MRLGTVSASCICFCPSCDAMPICLEAHTNVQDLHLDGEPPSCSKALIGVVCGDSDLLIFHRALAFIEALRQRVPKNHRVIVFGLMVIKVAMRRVALFLQGSWTPQKGCAFDEKRTSSEMGDAVLDAMESESMDEATKLAAVNITRRKSLISSIS